MKNLSFWGFLSFTVKWQLRMCRKSDQWIFGCFMGLRTGIRGSVDGGTDSAMEALEWPKTITTEQSTFLVQLNLIRSSKISVTRTDAEKSSKSFVITKIWVRPNWSQSEIFSESCLLSNPQLLRRGNRSWLPLFLLLLLQDFQPEEPCKTSIFILWEKNLWNQIHYSNR